MTDAESKTQWARDYAAANGVTLEFAIDVWDRTMTKGHTLNDHSGLPILRHRFSDDVRNAAESYLVRRFNGDYGAIEDPTAQYLTACAMCIVTDTAPLQPTATQVELMYRRRDAPPNR